MDFNLRPIGLKVNDEHKNLRPIGFSCKIQAMKKGEATRAHIIEKSAPVFNRLGFGNTSLAVLMEATGLEKGGIYRHFESKEELACEAFDYAVTQVRSVRVDPLARLASGIEKLETYIGEFATIGSPIPGGCPIFNTAVENDDGNSTLKKKALHAYKRWIEDLTAIIEQAIREGALKKNVDAERFAVFLMCSLEGGLVAKNLTQKTAILADISNELMSVLDSKRA